MKRAADAIIAALSVQSASGASAASGSAARSSRVRGDAADDGDPFRSPARLESLDERADDRALVPGGEIGAPRRELLRRRSRTA